MPPVSVLPPETLRLFDKGTNPKRPPMNEAYRSVATVRKILRAVPAVADSTATNDVYDIFQRQAELNVLAVLREGVPIGLIQRLRMLDKLARPYHRELYGNKPCAQFIENAPLIVDHKTSLQAVGNLINDKLGRASCRERVGQYG